MQGRAWLKADQAYAWGSEVYNYIKGLKSADSSTGL